MGNFYMESTQINYRRDDKLKTVDQKLQELSETSAIDTDIAPVFKSTNTYQPGDMVYYRNKLYVFNVEHTGTWAAADVTATDVTTEISSLKSGLTNVDVALNVPDGAGKNLIHMTLDSIKAFNTEGTWSGNTYTRNNVSFTVNTDNDGNVTSIDVNTSGASDQVEFKLNTATYISNTFGGMLINGCSDGSSSTYAMFIAYSNNGTSWAGEALQYSSDITISSSYLYIRVGILVKSGASVSNKTVYPMIRPAGTTPDFVPYIPSVESRLNVVESLLGGVLLKYNTTPDSAPYVENGSGTTWAIKKGDNTLGYLVIRPKNYLGANSKPVAMELYDASWGLAWMVLRDAT